MSLRHGIIRTAAHGRVSAYVANAILNPQLGFAPTSLAVSNGVFQALLTGPANATVIIETSTTLTNWTPVVTNPLPEGSWPVFLPNSANPQGYYRARLAP